MTTDLPVQRKRIPRLKLLLAVGAFVVFVAAVYVKTHPLVFNESFWTHAHCIPQAGLALSQYALDYDGRFPVHTNGYGDALLLLLAEGLSPSYALTGPGYDRFVFDYALTNRSDVPETDCGRVYVQGLSDTNNPEIAILFDKIPTPGGDHCHELRRIIAPLCREVLFVDQGRRTIKERDWESFSQKQIELLVQEGFSKQHAENLYAEKGKVR